MSTTLSPFSRSYGVYRVPDMRLKRLFAGNRAGMAVSVDRLEFLFQDAAGTIPVTAVG